MNITKDRVRGMFIGTAIGDALGMPTETLAAAEIKTRFGRITHYLRPNGHKWFNGRDAGTWTDDTQLSLVVAESLIATKRIDLNDLAERHAKTLSEDLGFGPTTRDALKKLAAGIHWSESGVTEKPNRGMGNGVAMKIAPLAAYFAAKYGSVNNLTSHELDAIYRLTEMTHHTGAALASALAHLYGVWYCLTQQETTFSSENLANLIDQIAHQADSQHGLETLRNPYLHTKLKKLTEHGWHILSPNKFIELFAKENPSLVINSLPLSYAFFLPNPAGIESLYDVIGAGGDTDTNGSMVGSLLGAFNGMDIFPRTLVQGLWQHEKILETADRFCETFEIRKEK